MTDTAEPGPPPRARDRHDPAATSSLRPIAELDLARFTPPSVPGHPGPLRRAAWYLVNATVFQGVLLGLVPSPVKAVLLRAFGARVGRGFVCKPRVNIKSPWFLELGDQVWLGEGVWIDGLAPVRIGTNVVISQGCYLGNGNHDWSRPDFPFFARPIRIGDGVWVTAFQRVLGGARIPAHHVIVGNVIGAIVGPSGSGAPSCACGSALSDGSGESGG